MSEQKKNDSPEKPGIDVETVTFDANGNVQGVEDSELDDVAGGLMVADKDSGCINGFNCG